MFKMKFSDISILENKISVVIPDSKTRIQRAFVITDVEWIDIIKQYINLRNGIESDRLFLQIRHGKITKQPFGHNSLAQFPKKIANYLELNDSATFTGHCFRRTAATLLSNSGADILQLKRLGGWKSNAVAEGYVETSISGQTKIASMLSSSTSTTKHEFNFSNKSAKQGLSVNIAGYDSSTINVYFNNNEKDEG